MATISNFLVVPSRVESGSSQTELQTNSDYAGGLSGMHTTTAGTLPSSIFRNFRFFFGFRKIIGNPEKKRILRSGGYSMVPLPLVLVSRDTWTTPEKTLAWWYESSSANMISECSLVRKSPNHVYDPSRADECDDMRHSTTLVLHTD